MDPYPYIKARYNGVILPAPLSNDVDWLLGEVERLRAIEAAAKKLLALEVSDSAASVIALAIIASGLREALDLDRPK